MSEPGPAVSGGRRPRAAGLPSAVRRAVELCQDRKARELMVLDLRNLSDATDFFIIASGDSEVHVRAISEHLVEELAKEGTRVAGIEGASAGRWVLLDYIDVVVHIFHPMVRQYYQLERLWGDAPVAFYDEPE
ncbi:MAG: ribosome silencing factor [Gemmatimonadota bacterium]|nr:MAG: ribosome silencing factor [Gemmatimonadota bacterium]